MTWTRYQHSWGLKLGDGFVIASINWAVTGAPGYVARINGKELGRTGDVEPTKRLAEAYILMKLAECQKQMET